MRLESRRFRLKIACKTEKEQTVFFTAVYPMFAHPHKQRGLRRDETQNCSLQNKLENISEYCVLGQFESCSEEGVDVAHTVTNSQMKIIHTWCAAEEHKTRENSWVLLLNSQGENEPMKHREDSAEAIKIKERLYEESGGARPKIHPSQQARQRANRSQDPVQEPNELTRKLDGTGIFFFFKKKENSVHPNSMPATICLGIANMTKMGLVRQ